MRLRFLLGAALAALILTACQPSASPTSSASAEASPEAGVSIGALPSTVGNPDLEATLPAEAADITFFQSFSMSGPDFLAAEVDDQFITFIDSLGADIADVSVAFALGANGDGTNTASIFAFQVAGAESEELVEQFKASAESSGDPLVWHPETVGGKSVEVAEPNDDFPTPIALYAVGDVLYFASSSSDQALEEIIEQLP